VEYGAGAVESVVTGGALPDPAFWRGKRVFLTGHTGFKGSWLAIWLKRMGAVVGGVALKPNTEPSLFGLAKVSELVNGHFGDIRDQSLVLSLCVAHQPEIILHLAAQPLVRASYTDPAGTFDTNVMGTVNILEAARISKGLRAVVMVTTDKVYLDTEQQSPFRESDTLGGHDPYSASKAASELVVAAYRSSYLKEKGVAVATARAGNVIGGGDWAQDRLIPDVVRAWSAGGTLNVRRPSSVRPWNHVIETLTGYLVLAERLWESPQLAAAWNFGPPPHEELTVRTIVEMARRVYGAGDVAWGASEEGPHETHWLSLDNSRARLELGVAPRWDAATALERTIRWYRRQQDGADPRRLCEADIDHYETIQ
jgi:CDP-glucose 4,6-dehydratase